MRKLRLELEALEVDTFQVAPDDGSADGTVFGRMPIEYLVDDFDGGGGGAGGATGPSNPVCIGPTYCCNPTANTTCCPAPTWQQTCAYSCEATCGATCPYSCNVAECIP